MKDNEAILYPLLFEPVLKSYVWGGRNLERSLGRTLPDGVIAESWEIAAHEDGVTVVTNGPYAGMSLTAVHDMLGLDLIGRNNSWAQERGKFPLLIKLLDAHDKLSVQVHPGDDYALEHEGNELGKTEMWVVLHAEPDSQIILGLKSGTTPANFSDAIAEGDIESCLHFLKLQRGDYVCVPSGSVHAILGGLLIAEIQQNSNTTYRVYDWNRTANGAARPLHVGQAMDVINFDLVEPAVQQPRAIGGTGGVQRELLCSNQYFTTERIVMEPGSSYGGNLDGSTLEIWGVIDGQIAVKQEALKSVQFTLLPAAMGEFEVSSSQGAVCLRTYVE